MPKIIPSQSSNKSRPTDDMLDRSNYKSVVFLVERDVWDEFVYQYAKMNRLSSSEVIRMSLDFFYDSLSAEQRERLRAYGKRFEEGKKRSRGRMRF
jgi:hypothetical protein